jgi:hypothetical protein
MNQHKLLAKTNIFAKDWEKEFTVRFQATFEEKLSPAPENVAILGNYSGGRGRRETGSECKT